MLLTHLGKRCDWLISATLVSEEYTPSERGPFDLQFSHLWSNLRGDDDVPHLRAI